MEIYAAGFEGRDLAGVLLALAGLVGGGWLAWALIGAAFGLLFSKKK